MSINAKKSQVIHVCNYQKHRSKTPLYCSGQMLEYVDTYKYLGYHIHEHLSHNRTVDILTASAKRAFGKIVTIFKKLKDSLTLDIKINHEEFLVTEFREMFVPVYEAKCYDKKEKVAIARIDAITGKFL